MTKAKANTAASRSAEENDEGGKSRRSTRVDHHDDTRVITHIRARISCGKDSLTQSSSSFCSWQSRSPWWTNGQQEPKARMISSEAPAKRILSELKTESTECSLW